MTRMSDLYASWIQVVVMGAAIRRHAAASRRFRSSSGTGRRADGARRRTTPGPDAASTCRLASRVAKSRAANRFMSDPSSTRNALILIIVGNLTVVFIGGVIVLARSIGGNTRH